MILLNEPWREQERARRRAEGKRLVWGFIHALAWLGLGIMFGWLAGK